MSIGILINVHDGIVLAADSASTLTLIGPQPNQPVVNVYNNANKIANLYKGTWTPQQCREETVKQTKDAIVKYFTS